MICPYKVSILVPVYKVSKYIEACAESIFRQTYDYLEVMFIDDATPDDSIDIVKRTLSNFPTRKNQVNIIRHPKNKGLAAARNTAVAAATGEFVYHLDADDWIEPNTIEEMVKEQMRTDADIVSAKFAINKDETDPHYMEPDYPSKDAMITDFLSQPWHHEVAGRLLRRRLYINNDITCIEGCNMAEDWHVSPMLVWYANGLAFIHRKFYHYRQNPASMVHANKSANVQLQKSIEAYRNVSSLQAFFLDKSKKYTLLALELCCPMCYQILMATVSTGNRQLFDDFKKEILSYPKAIRNRNVSLSHRVILCLPKSYHLERVRHMMAQKMRH